MTQSQEWIPRDPSIRARCLRVATLYESGVTVHELARCFGISVATVYRSLQIGRRFLQAQNAVTQEIEAELR